MFLTNGTHTCRDVQFQIWRRKKMSTKVVLIRHEAPRSGEVKPLSNTLNQASRDRAFCTGEQLAKLGIVINVAASSPQFRAVETLQNVLAGNSAGKGPIILSGVNDAFGDMLLGQYPYTEEEKGVIMAQAAVAKMSAEQLLMTCSEFAEKQRNRGVEGAIALMNFVKYAKVDATIAICSHGGSRLESMIQVLVDKMDPRPSVAMMEPGEAAVLIFGDNDGPVAVSYEYIGHPGDALVNSSTTA